jgi:hypothetical protein
MTALILYASHKAVHPDSQPIRTGQSVIWIRVEEIQDTLTNALDLAKPLYGEIVLNTIYKTNKET